MHGGHSYSKLIEEPNSIMISGEIWFQIKAIMEMR